MKSITKTITLTPDDNRAVWVLMSDLHIGALSVDENAIRADVETIASNPSWNVLLLGDVVNAQNRKHHHYKESEHKQWLSGQDDVVGAEINYATDMLAPIASQIVGYVAGNHEHNQLKYADRDVYYEIAYRLTAPIGKKAPDIMLGYNGYVSVAYQYRYKTNKTGDRSRHNIFCHHGHGGGRAVTSVTSKLNQLSQAYHADVYAIGHHHKRDYVMLPFSTVTSRGTVEHKHRLALGVASYMRTHTPPRSDGTPRIGYANERAYANVPIGASVFVHTPRRSGATAKTTVIQGDYERLSEIEYMLK